MVFANATCFEPEMVEQVERVLRARFEPGQVFVLTTKALDLDEADFTLVGPFSRRMSWGNTLLRAYIKK